MEIKEVENLLSVSRTNIRFYEKMGLLNPERNENNYRQYSESDIAILKKIIVLRKLGFSVEEISSMQKGDLSLSDALEKNIACLESEIEKLTGSLETAKVLFSEQVLFEDMDEDRYWNMIRHAENDGKEFTDICKDCLTFELRIFDNMWKYVFFHDFGKSRKKHGAAVACGILLLICIIRGIGSAVFWHESFWNGFLYPIIIFLIGSAITLPIYILSKKAPKTARVISVIIMILGIGFLAFCGLLILCGIIMSIFA